MWEAPLSLFLSRTRAQALAQRLLEEIDLKQQEVLGDDLLRGHVSLCVQHRHGLDEPVGALEPEHRGDRLVVREVLRELRKLSAERFERSERITVRLERPGPAVAVEPWRARAAERHELNGAAIPVQRRLLRAS